MLFRSSPRVFAGFPTIEFLAPNNPKIDSSLDELSSISLKENEGALFVVIPENFATLNAIAHQFPNGQLVEVPRITTMNEMLYYAYIVPPR